MRLFLTLLALTCTLGLSACGVKGPLDPPPAAKAEAEAAKSAPARKPGEPPRKPFVLDSLL